MNTPLSWIKAYVPELECTDQEYMDAMTLSGTKCEGFENEGAPKNLPPRGRGTAAAVDEGRCGSELSEIRAF